MPQFRKKPVVVEAFCFGADRAPKWWKAAVDAGSARVITPVPGDGDQYVLIETLEATTLGRRGDWVIKGVGDELSLCDPATFEATFEAMPADAAA